MGWAARVFLLLLSFGLAPAARADRLPRSRADHGGPHAGELLLGAHTHLSVIDFSRRGRDCRLPASEGGGAPAIACPEERSLEAAVGFGLSVALRAAGPIHLSFGLDVGFTDPEIDALSPQTVLTMPFGVLLTVPSWPVRPVAEALAVPFLLIPDGVKNVAFGGRGGLALRAGGIDVELTVGYATSEAMRPWEFRAALVHRP